MKYFPKFSLILMCCAFMLMGSVAVAQAEYKVVINHEEQYSIWPADKAVSDNWKETGVSGTQKQCADHINKVWTDMRPLSVRNLKLPKDTQYHVVINHEEQYMIYPIFRKPPKGWKPASQPGNLKHCRKYIEEVWTDMRPLSIRK